MIGVGEDTGQWTHTEDDEGDTESEDEGAETDGDGPDTDDEGEETDEDKADKAMDTEGEDGDDDDKAFVKSGDGAYRIGCGGRRPIAAVSDADFDLVPGTTYRYYVTLQYLDGSKEAVTFPAHKVDGELTLPEIDYTAEDGWESLWDEDWDWDKEDGWEKDTESRAAFLTFSAVALGAVTGMLM